MTTSRSGLRWVRLGLAVALISLVGAAPAAASVAGPCSASVNGVEIERIDSLASPLELTVDDTLTFHGMDENGTKNAAVELKIASIRIDEGTTTYGPTQNEFTASIDLADISPYGVGLFRIRGTTDNCEAEAWVRVGGKLPLATLTGITGLGLALGGLTGQLASVASRRRFSWIAAAVAGVATGLGGSVLGQQFGRLQLSYISIALAVAGCAAVGAVAAYLFRLKSGLGWLERRRYAAEERREQREETRIAKQDERQRRDEERARRAAERERRATDPKPGATEIPATAEAVATVDPLNEPDDPFDKTFAAATQPAPTPVPTPVRQPDPEPSPAETPSPVREPTTETRPPAEPAAPYWCYVMSAVEVLDLQEPTRVIAVLQPGNWYLARREAGEWVHVVAAGNLEGWAPRNSVHRQG